MIPSRIIEIIYNNVPKKIVDTLFKCSFDR